jgi:hypothetical protein
MYTKEEWAKMCAQLITHIVEVTLPEGQASDSQDAALYELQGQMNDAYVAWQQQGHSPITADLQQTI